MKKLLVIVLFFAGALSLGAQSSTMFNFAKIDANPVTAGMGGAAYGQSQLAFGAFTNPSLMSFNNKNYEISLGYQNFAPKLEPTHNATAAFGCRFGKASLSVAGTYIIEHPYDIVTGPTGAVTATYTPKNLQAGVAFAYQILDFLSAGVNGRFYYSQFAEESKYMGFGANAFVGFHMGMFTATAGVSNVGPKVKKQFAIPMSATIAGSVNATELGPCAILADVDLDCYFNGGVGVNAGAEFSLKDIFAIRAGYHFGSEKAPIPSYASAGVSLGYKLFHVNATYMFASKTLANTFSIGLNFIF